MKGEHFFSELPDSLGHTVIVLVGPNGSGKSSIARLLGLTNVNAGDRRYRGRLVVDDVSGEVLLPLVNADEIAKRVKMRHPERDWDECNLEAAKEASRMREALSGAMLDFGFETVGSHPSKVEDLRRYKRMGYRIVILFVTTESPDINVRRVEQRRRSGGHDVPEDKVRARYGRTMAYFVEYLKVADLMVVYDNSEDHVVDDGQGPKLLLVKRGDATTLTKHGQSSPWLGEALKGSIL